MTPPSVPAHCSFYVLIFFSSSSIKKLKLSGELICATPGAFIEDPTPQKITAKILSAGLFCGSSFYKRREKNCKEKKKNDHPLVIGENYINKMFLYFSFNIFYGCFYLSLNCTKTDKYSHQKGR